MLKRLEISLLILTLTIVSGCKSGNILVSNNTEKDKYIDAVEGIVSQSASALIAVSPSVSDPVSRELMESQIIRLSGISKPSVEKVEFYRKAVKEQNFKEIKKDKEDSEAVDKKTNLLWEAVEKQNQKISEASLLLEQEKLKRKEEDKIRLVEQANLAFLSLIVIGILGISFSPLYKKAFIILVTVSSLALAGVWWFIS